MVYWMPHLAYHCISLLWSPNHQHPVSLSLTCEKTNKVEKPQAVPFPSLPSLHPVLPLELVANLKGPPPIPKGEAWHQPPMSPVNYDLWRNRRRKGEEERGTALDVSSAPWSKSCTWTLSELHNFLESDPLWPNTKRLWDRERMYLHSCEAKSGSLCNILVCWNSVCLKKVTYYANFTFSHLFNINKCPWCVYSKEKTLLSFRPGPSYSKMCV